MEAHHMAWLYVIIAGLFEVSWAISLKYTEGFTRLWISVFNTIVLLLGIVFLSKSLATLPVGTAYAVWTGIGVIGTTVLGIILFNESRDWLRLVFILLIIAGIIGLKLTTTPEAPVNVNRSAQPR
jgi:quaternary ammonium compound-resistance protein SugE